MGSTGLHRSQIITLGAVVIVSFIPEGCHNSLIAAPVILTYDPAVLVLNAFLKDHLLGHGFLIFLFGQLALVMHFRKDSQLAAAVALGTVAFLPFPHVHALGIGIEDRGIVGNTDQGRAFRGGQALKLLTEIFGSGALNSVAATAQIDPVQILHHDLILGVDPFAELGPENLHDLTLNGNTLLLSGILDQLLGDGGAAEIAVSEEHIHAGLDRSDPVHALMLIKPLVFNCHGSVDHRLGDLVQGSHLTIHHGVDLLQLLNITVAVHIIQEGCFLHTVILNGPALRLRQNVILQVVAQCTHKDHAAYQNNHNNRGCRANGDLQYRKSHGQKGIQCFQQPVGIPLLTGLLCSPSGLLFIFHGK